MKLLYTASVCTLLLATAPSYAASVYHCIDEAGHSTFTRQGCPASQTARVQDAFNPTPSSGKATLMAKPKQRSMSSPRNSGTALMVVGEQDDGCGNRITGNARRNAMISQQIRSGMTRADIESTFGTPDAVSSRNGQTQYRYSDNQGRTRTVSFDENGCVRGKR